MAGSIYNIPAGVPFAETLARGLLEQTGGNAQKLTAIKVLLPTRRACRNLRETFLKLSDGKPMLLPRMQPLGDVEEEDLSLEMAVSGNQDAVLNLPAALPPLQRQILLARLIDELPDFTQGFDQAMDLASALGRLMDQIYTEGLDLKDLDKLVPDEFADHWQVTIDFLKILSEAWPKILAEHNVIDGADRRNRLIRILTDHWRDNPPQTPIIAAGSTGSIPATADLLGVVANLPQGSVILPGLDQIMDQDSWEQLDDTHPQATLRQLLGHLNVERADVEDWLPLSSKTDVKTEKQIKVKQWLASEIMRPAATADRWMQIKNEISEGQKYALQESLQTLRRFDCDTEQEEAQLIAVIMRETLEIKGKTAALITPDRQLAGRVAAACKRWNIIIDDSAGQTLSDTLIGTYLKLVLAVPAQQFSPSSLTNLLKHDYCRAGLNHEAFDKAVEDIERKFLRGSRPESGIESLRKRSEDDCIILDKFDDVYKSFITLLDNNYNKFSTYLDQLINTAETLAQSDNAKTDKTLWQGEAGEAAALFLSNLYEQAGYFPDMSFSDFTAIIEQLMKNVTIRPRFGTHPRLAILGQLEARLIQADTVILGGLNEGSWPPEPATDPWMSRPMKKEFGLPSAERSTGLSAHDFAQGFCTGNVILTRAKRKDGAPTVPARWLQRLETVLHAIKVDPAILERAEYLAMVKYLDSPDGPAVPYERPAPCPPVEKRPVQLSVTAIERWLYDPYSIYARYILNLKKLDDIEENSDAADRGTALHKVFDRFITETKAGLPQDAETKIMALGYEILPELMTNPAQWTYWQPRYEKLARWFVRHEDSWRQSGMTPQKTETTGYTQIETMTISAKVDRIDSNSHGKYAIIDYKTGSYPNKPKVLSGFSSQLQIAGMIIQDGGFDELQANEIDYMGFWQVTGAAQAGLDYKIKIDQGYGDLIDETREGLTRLIRTFNDKRTAYLSLPRPDKEPPADWQDYRHLARVEEWADIDDDTEAA